MIFFCACPFPRSCHRRIVTKLILKEAQRLGRRVEVVEWPGRAPLRRQLRLNRTVYDAASRGLVHVPLPGDRIPRALVGLPWGSIVDVQAGKQRFPIISGPAIFRDGWLLPIWERYDAKTKSDRLSALSGNFRRRNGLERSETPKAMARTRARPKALTIRQPWAHSIIHLGKDVENRSWRTDYKGISFDSRRCSRGT
jgi:hypothetical protein